MTMPFPLSMHCSLLNLRTELFHPLWPHQRSTEKMRPNLIAMKNQSMYQYIIWTPSVLLYRYAVLIEMLACLFFGTRSSARPSTDGSIHVLHLSFRTPLMLPCIKVDNSIQNKVQIAAPRPL